MAEKRALLMSAIILEIGPSLHASEQARSSA